jgi:predicted small lipoprotein YifL
MSLQSTFRVWAAVLALAAPLAACGKMGQLQRPGPLFGVETQTTQQADERVRQTREPNGPVDTIDPRDQVTDPGPPRTLPIEGTSPDPNRTALPGALPDPYANPR